MNQWFVYLMKMLTSCNPIAPLYDTCKYICEVLLCLSMEKLHFGESRDRDWAAQCELSFPEQPRALLSRYYINQALSKKVHAA